MKVDVQLAIYSATVVLNFAVALAVGAAMASLWLAKGRSDWSQAQLRKLRPVRLTAIVVAIVAMGALLLFVSASMAEVPVADAGEAVRSMLTESHFGIAWSVGMTALIPAALALAMSGPRPWLRRLAVSNLGALAVFVYTRSLVSHAAANGDLSLATVADWVHLCLISVWVGAVFISGLVTLAGQVASPPAEREEVARYVENLSSSATFALVGIFATGLFSAWHNIGSVAGLSGNPYGNTLLIKLGLVACAALLGAFNRFIVMPSLLASLRRDAQRSAVLQRRFTQVLRIEALVLLLVLVAAAVLGATSPPTAA